MENSGKRYFYYWIIDSNSYVFKNTSIITLTQVGRGHRWLSATSSAFPASRVTHVEGTFKQVSVSLNKNWIPLPKMKPFI